MKEQAVALARQAKDPAQDVAPFLAHPQEAALLTRENIGPLLGVG